MNSNLVSVKIDHSVDQSVSMCLSITLNAMTDGEPMKQHSNIRIFYFSYVTMSHKQNVDEQIKKK